MKRFFLLLLIAFAGTTTNAQFQRRTVEERVKMVHEKLDSAFNHPDPKIMVQLDSAFAEYYKAQDKMREELMAGGGPPDDATREAMRTKVEELVKQRDEKLQKVLTEAQYKQWKDEMEPALRPRRQMRQ